VRSLSVSCRSGKNRGIQISPVDIAAGIPDSVTHRKVNPALELIPVKWLNLPEFFSDRYVIPKPGEGLCSCADQTGESMYRSSKSRAGDLLALKLVVEDIDSRKAAFQGNVSVGTIDDLLYRAEKRGLIIVPPSRIRRPEDFPKGT
jgi:hypothetical protein